MKKHNFFQLSLVGFLIFTIPISQNFKNNNENENKTDINTFYNKPPSFEISNYETNGNNSAAVINSGSSEDLYVWGDNSYGQIGNGTRDTNTSYFSPEKITTGDNELPQNWWIDDVKIGINYMGVIVNDGTTQYLYMWGDNSNGKIDDSKNSFYETPTLVATSNETQNIKDMSLGNNTSSILVNDENGDHVYTWGSNEYGLLGISNDDTSYETSNFNEILGVTPEDEIINLNMGMNHAGVVTKNIETGTNDLYMWGDNTYGQLAIDSSTTAIETCPTIITSLSGTDITSFDIGMNHSGIISDGDVYTWGDNTYGQLGVNPDTIESSFDPIIIDTSEANISTAQQISLGYNHTGVLTSNVTPVDANDSIYAQSIYTWGNNENGQLGRSLSDGSSMDWHPVEIEQVNLNIIETNLLKIKSINFNGNQSMSLISQDNNDALYSWGDNTYGQLGIGYLYDRYDPQDLYFLPKFYRYSSQNKQVKITTTLSAIQFQVYDRNKLLENVINNSFTNITLYGNFYLNSIGHVHTRTIKMSEDVAPVYDQETYTWTLTYVINDLTPENTNTLVAADGLGINTTPVRKNVSYASLEGNTYFINSTNSIKILQEQSDGIIFSVKIYEPTDLFKKNPNLNVTINDGTDTQVVVAEKIYETNDVNDPNAFNYIYQISGLPYGTYSMIAIENILLAFGAPTNIVGTDINLTSQEITFTVAETPLPPEASSNNGWMIFIWILVAIGIGLFVVLIFMYIDKLIKKNKMSKSN